MQDGSSVRLTRYLPHAVVATLLVFAIPALAVLGLQARGLANSLVLSIAVGAVMSVATATFGSALWMRHKGSRDIVFADLMVWGLVRRLRVERYVADMKRVADAGGSLALGSDVSPERQIEVLTALARALETRDPYTHGHSRRVARHAYMIAKAMKLSRAEAELIRTAGAVHDVGKIHVPYEVLTKPGRLTDEEFAAIKEHSSKGAELVSLVGNDKLTAIVRHHHERLDGGGYPDRLRGGDIPIGARIIAVADTFDAITSTRSYRGASKHKKAIEILKKEAGTQLDADSVHAFLSYYRGRRAVAWWSTLGAMPQRLLGKLPSLLGEAAGASSLAGTVVAVSTVAAVAGAALSPGAVVRAEPSAAEVVTARSQGDSEGSVLVAEAGDSDQRLVAKGQKRRYSKNGRPKGKPGPRRPDGHPTGSVDGSGSSTSGPGSAGSGSGGSGSTGGSGSSGGSGSGGSGDGGLVDDTVDTVDDTVDVVDDTVDDVVDTVDDTVGDVTGGGSSGSGSSDSGSSGSDSGSSGSGSGSSGSGSGGGGGLIGGLLDTVGGLLGG
jgi:hypothetical protein